MTRETEAKIIESVLSGDINAYERLVLENQKKVYNLALKMTGNKEDAYDISQEAFIKAFNSLKSFRGESSFGVWIYRLTSNLCIDFMRREKKRRSVSLVYINDEQEEQELEIPDLRFEPEAQLEREELKQAIDDAIGSLADDHKQVLILREVVGLSYTEIADTLNLEIGTVKSRIFRARMKIIRMLTAKGNILEDKTSKKRKRGERHEGMR